MEAFTDYQRITNRMMDLLTERSRWSRNELVYKELLEEFVVIIEDETYTEEVDNED